MKKIIVTILMSLSVSVFAEDFSWADFEVLVEKLMANLFMKFMAIMLKLHMNIMQKILSALLLRRLNNV